LTYDLEIQQSSSGYMLFIQNFIWLSAAVHEFVLTEKKNSGENNTTVARGGE